MKRTKPLFSRFYCSFFSILELNYARFIKDIKRVMTLVRCPPCADDDPATPCRVQVNPDVFPNRRRGFFLLSR